MWQPFLVILSWKLPWPQVCTLCSCGCPVCISGCHTRLREGTGLWSTCAMAGHGCVEVEEWGAMSKFFMNSSTVCRDKNTHATRSFSKHGLRFHQRMRMAIFWKFRLRWRPIHIMICYLSHCVCKKFLKHLHWCVFHVGLFSVQVLCQFAGNDFITSGDVCM